MPCADGYASAMAQEPNVETDGEIVLLLHGLWTGGWAMQPLRLRLAAAGFAPKTFSYPSYRASLDRNAQGLCEHILAMASPVVHLVGHSLGGLVILRALASLPASQGGRVVLLGSPVRDSLAVRRLAESEAGRMVIGPSLLEWIDSGGAAQVAGREIGIVAGSHSMGMGRIVAPDLPEPNDGAVTVAETQASFAHDHIALPVSHSAMLLSKEVAEQLAGFLRKGRFDHGATATAH